MKKLATILVVSSLLLRLTWLRPSSHAATRQTEFQGPVMKAHFIDVGQANATLLEFKCGVVLIDAGADQEHEEALVEFLNRFFDDRPAFQRTIKLVLITHNHIDHTMALDSVVKNFKVERYIDHGMLEGRGTENPNWIRDAVV